MCIVSRTIRSEGVLPNVLCAVLMTVAEKNGCLTDITDGPVGFNGIFSISSMETGKQVLCFEIADAEV